MVLRGGRDAEQPVLFGTMVDIECHVLTVGRRGRFPLDFLECRGYRPVLCVAENDDERRAEARGREFDAPDLRRRDDIARDPDDEEVAKALVEDDLRGYA